MAAAADACACLGEVGQRGLPGHAPGAESGPAKEPPSAYRAPAAPLLCSVPMSDQVRGRVRVRAS